MIYLDANVFVYATAYSKNADPRVANAVEILTKVGDGIETACTSSLTWDELVWAVRKTSGGVEALEQGARFLELLNLSRLPVTEQVLRRAQFLAEKYGLKPRDAIHAATCIQNGFTKIVSDDADFDRVSGLKRIPL